MECVRKDIAGILFDLYNKNMSQSLHLWKPPLQ